jgi:hypothetical protein
MKKVIRLTESDLMRIVKRVINEQQQETETDITPEVKQYLNINPDGTLTSNEKIIYEADKLIKTANLSPTMSTVPLKNTDIGATKIYTSGDQYGKELLEGFQRNGSYKNLKYWDTVKYIMQRVTKGTIVFQPFNGGKQVGPYGAKYMPGPSDNLRTFILVPCTKQQPCIATN